jgi:hypothetical protein
VELKITLSAGVSPSCYEGEIPCHIVWASNKYSTEDNDITQKDVLMTAQKESLFLRIRKAPNLNVDVSFMKVRKNISVMPALKDARKSLFDHVFESIFSSALNDPDILELVGALEEEESPIVDLLSCSTAIGIGSEVLRP